jgi:hypothetical protein
MVVSNRSTRSWESLQMSFHALSLLDDLPNMTHDGLEARLRAVEDQLEIHALAARFSDASMNET